MEWFETPLAALYHGARNERDRAAIGLLDREGWWHRPDVARHVTVTVGGDGEYDDDCSLATVDWEAVVGSLAGIRSDTVPARASWCVVAVACSLACGHNVDLAKVAEAVQPRPDMAAWIVSALLDAAGHSDHVVRWPRRSRLPSYVRILDPFGAVIQEAGATPGEDWHEIGRPRLRKVPET